VSVVKEALRGERFAAAAYDDAVHDLLPPQTRDIVEYQDIGLRVAARLMEEEIATH
jgi:hypothetical protein